MPTETLKETLALILIPSDPRVIVSSSCGRKIETMKSLSDVETLLTLFDRSMKHCEKLREGENG